MYKYKYRTQVQNTNTEHKTQNTFRWPPDGSRDLNSNCLPSGNVSTLVDFNKNQRKVIFLISSTNRSAAITKTKIKIKSLVFIYFPILDKPNQSEALKIGISFKSSFW